MNSKSILKKFIFLLLALFACTQAIHSQEAIKKSTELLNKNIILGDYAKAYNYAQFIMKYYEGEEIPEESLLSVQNAVSGYAGYLEINSQWDKLLELESELSGAPISVQKEADSSIKKAHNYFAELELQKEREALKKKEQEEAEKKLIAELKQQETAKKLREEKLEDTKKLLDLFESQRKLDMEKEKIRAEEQRVITARQLELEQARQDSEKAYRTEFNEIIREISTNNSEAMKSFSSNNRTFLIGLVFFILLFIGTIVFLVLLAMKQSRQNHEQMKNTIIAMQAMRLSQPVMEALPISMQLEKGTLSIGSSQVSDRLQLEDNRIATAKSPENQSEDLKKLLLECKKYGEQIDLATGRKNVTSQVAELVYKISQNLEYSEQEAILYYAAALVYDIGFLNIESSILNASVLSPEQFTLLKTHTTIGENMMFFVPEEYRQLFKDAAGKHHEKIDGSGYPSALKGEAIPYIARVIHVVESYIALISQRQYKEIHDRNFAIDELRNSGKQYDQKIIDALDEIV